MGNFNIRLIGRISEIHDRIAFLETTKGSQVKFNLTDTVTRISEGDIVTFLSAKHIASDIGVPMGGFVHEGVYTKIPFDCQILSIFDYEEVRVMKRVIERTLTEQRTQYRIFHRDDFTCKCCGKKAIYALKASFRHEKATWKFYTEDWSPLTIDHIHPASKGGPNHHTNYQTMCQICNFAKGDTVEGEEVKEEVKMPSMIEKFEARKLKAEQLKAEVYGG